MKKFIFKSLNTICICSLLCLALSSCQNFMEGSGFKKQLDEDIAYANAEKIQIRIQAAEGSGTPFPNGDQTVKKGYDFEVNFSENPTYSFIEWRAVSKEDESKTIDGVEFENPKSAKTKVKVTKSSSDIRILPYCIERIAIKGEVSPSPSSSNPWTSSIFIPFSKLPSASSFIFNEEEIPEGAVVKTDDDGNIWAYTINNHTYLKNIAITSSSYDGPSIAEHFLQPQINSENSSLTIPVDIFHPFNFSSSGDSKTIYVTLMDSITDEYAVTMNSQKQWSYNIVNETNEKASINLSCLSSEGSLKLAGTSKYDIMSYIPLNFTEASDYQFIKWEYDSTYLAVDEETNPNTKAYVKTETPAGHTSQITAVCAPRLRVNEFSPAGTSAVCKNSPITIVFNKELPDDEEGLKQLENISIAIGGIPVKSCFYEPEIDGNTVTFIADNSNMLDLAEGQNKTVTVSIPDDFYYLMEDGTKVFYGGNGKSFNYKIDSTTLQKASVTFTAPANSGELTKAKGSNNYSIGQEVEIAFAPKDGWRFMGWTITSGGQPVSDSKIKILDKGALSTKLIVYEAVQGVTVTAAASEILKITKTSPSLSVNPKDSKIQITFNKTLPAANSSNLDKIKILMDGENVDSFFTTRKLSGNTITISTNYYLSVLGNQTKTINVYIPALFYYTDNSQNIYLPEDYEFNYVINSSTGIAYKIIYSVSPQGAGKIKDLDLNSYVTLDQVTESKKNEINLSFESENYRCDTWELYYADEDGDILEFCDEEAGLDYTSEHSEQSVFRIWDNPIDDNILKVHAFSYKIPKVESVKVDNKTSIYNTGIEGFSCDSKIYIKFNKAMLASSVTISSLSITKAGKNVSPLFEYSFETSDTLVIRPRENLKKSLVPGDTDICDLEINLNANGNAIRDAENIGHSLELSDAIQNSFTIPFTINGQRETTAPVWGTGSALKSDGTSSGKTLSTSAYSAWSKTKNGTYTYGTYSQNHVGSSVYYTMYGADTDSGISALKIRETQYRTRNNEVVSSFPVETEITSKTLYDSIKRIYKFAGTYNFKTTADGIIKLDFQYIDNAGNVSDTRTWYVVKDSYLTTGDFVPVIDFHTSTNNRDVVPAEVTNGQEKDLFFTASTDMYSDVSVNMYWGYSLSSMTKISPSSSDSWSSKYSFTRDADKSTFVKVICMDSVNNTREKIYAIPPEPDFDTISVSEPDRHGNVHYYIHPYSVSTFKALATEAGAQGFRLSALLFENGKTISESNILGWMDEEPDVEKLVIDTSACQSGKTYRIYLRLAFLYEEGSRIYSTLSPSYAKVIMNSSGEISAPTVVHAQTSISNSSYFKDPVSVTATPVKGSGCYKVEVQDFRNSLSTYPSGITYSVKAVNRDTNAVFIQKGFSINLPSPGSYNLYMLATNSANQTATSSWLYTYVNGASEYNRNYSIDLTGDLTPPDTGTIYAGITRILSSSSRLSLYYEQTTDSDNKVYIKNYGFPLGTDVMNSISYYILPPDISYCSESDLSSYTKKTVNFNKSVLNYYVPHASSSRQGIITLPYGDLDEGDYTVCFVAEDYSGNKNYNFVPVTNKRNKKKIGFSYNSSTKTLSNSQNCAKAYYYFDNEYKNRWILWQYTYNGTSITDSNGDLNSKWVKIIGSDNYSYYEPEYAYIGTKYTCNNKNIMDLQNGLQVFCDLSTFIHTMYSPVKLTETNTVSDIGVWESKGMETGIKIKSANFTYGSENLSEIPTGWYYTTVVHFMDGTTLMSEVKQK